MQRLAITIQKCRLVSVSPGLTTPTSLPFNSSCSRNMDIDNRPPVNTSYDHTTTDSTLSAHHAGDENCPSGLLFGNPVLLLAFNQTISAKEKNEPIDLCKIITDAAGGGMGLSVEADQLKALFA